jgi:hypothetical protein
MRIIDMLHGWQLAVYLVLIVGCAVPSTLFVVLYGTLLPWWESRMGQFMFYMGVVIALSLDLGAVRLFWQSPPWLSFVVFIMVFIMVWWMLILFIVTYLKGKRKRLEDHKKLVKEDHNGPN